MSLHAIAWSRPPCSRRRDTTSWEHSRAGYHLALPTWAPNLLAAAPPFYVPIPQSSPEFSAGRSELARDVDGSVNYAVMRSRGVVLGRIVEVAEPCTALAKLYSRLPVRGHTVRLTKVSKPIYSLWLVGDLFYTALRAYYLGCMV